jgi:hypothetical protein
VHLLVGVGFVMMLSRPDPLRDTLLAYRYTEGVIAGLALFAGRIDDQSSIARRSVVSPICR